jgi:hypothetical protein
MIELSLPEGLPFVSLVRNLVFLVLENMENTKDTKEARSDIKALKLGVEFCNP